MYYNVYNLDFSSLLPPCRRRAGSRPLRAVARGWPGRS